MDLRLGPKQDDGLLRVDSACRNRCSRWVSMAAERRERSTRARVTDGGAAPCPPLARLRTDDHRDPEFAFDPDVDALADGADA